MHGSPGITSTGIRSGVTSKSGLSANTGRCFALRTGFVGLPNVGKSTLFNAVVENGKAEAANFPFCTIEPNVGVVAVPDARLDALSALSSSKKMLPTTMEYVDIAGLVRGASEGEGLGNKFLSHIREVDAIVEVVRCFQDDDVVHVAGQVDPVEDARTINFELALADIAQIERRLERLDKTSKGRNKDEAERAVLESEALRTIASALEDGGAARTVIDSLEEDARKAVDQLFLLTAKPLIYAANVDEMSLADEGTSNAFVSKLRDYASAEGAEVVVVSAKVESELQQLEQEEKEEFLQDLGCSEGGLPRLINATYRLLGLRTYFTSGEKETRAWTIKSGMTAPQAAGVIHTDFEKGFIRAETISYDDFIKYKGPSGAKESGTMRLEGKEYVVREGDVMLFRFNV